MTHWNSLKTLVYTAILVTLLLSTSSCTMKDPKLSVDRSNEIQKAINKDLQASQKYRGSTVQSKDLPDAVARALLPGISVSGMDGASDRDQDQHFDVAANNVPVKDFFMGLVKGTKYNMSINPEVTGMVTMDLKNVTVPEVMDKVQAVYGYEYQVTTDGFEVLPRKLESKIFHVDYLNVDRSGNSDTAIGAGEITKTSSQFANLAITGATQQQTVSQSGRVQTSSKADFWKDLQKNLTAIIGDQDGRNVVANPQSGSIIVRAYPDELRSVAKYLDDIQTSMGRQVVIEAEIMEVQLSAAYQTGINWKLLGIEQGAYYSSSSTPDSSIPQIDNIPNDFSSVFTLHASAGGTFSTMIQLLNTQGKVNILSSPKISTTNNQKAVIKVGTDRFFVTNVTSNTTSGTATTNSQNVELTPFFSGIALDVTPQIDAEDNIILHVHPIVSKVVQDTQKFEVNGLPNELPLAKSTIRESDSVVHAKSGQIVVIGGLMADASDSYSASTPGTENTGFLSNLFRSVNKRAEKLELVILLKPVVINSNKDWTKTLKESTNAFKTTQGEYSYRIVKGKG